MWPMIIGAVSQATVNPWQYLVAGYKLDGDAIDSSPNANNGTIVGALGFSDGKYGQSPYNFHTSRFINIGNPASMQLTGDLTLCAWVYPTSYVNYMGIFGAGHLYGPVYGYGIHMSSTHISGQIRDTTNSVARASFPHGGNYLNEWNHMTLRINGNTMELLFNAESKVISDISGITRAVPSENWAIGIVDRGPSWAFHFLGKIDECCLFNKALTNDEIIEVMKGIK